MGADNDKVLRVLHRSRVQPSRHTDCSVLRRGCSSRDGRDGNSELFPCDSVPLRFCASAPIRLCVSAPLRLCSSALLRLCAFRDSAADRCLRAPAIPPPTVVFAHPRPCRRPLSSRTRDSAAGLYFCAPAPPPSTAVVGLGFRV